MKTFTCLLLLLGLSTPLSLSANDRPNILLVMVEDMGYSDLGCFGGEIRTPTLDAGGEWRAACEVLQLRSMLAAACEIILRPDEEFQQYRADIDATRSRMRRTSAIPEQHSRAARRSPPVCRKSPSANASLLTPVRTLWTKHISGHTPIGTEPERASVRFVVGCCVRTGRKSRVVSSPTAPAWAKGLMSRCLTAW